MTTKKRKRKWLSLVLAFVMVLGLVPVLGITAKAATITEVAVTIDLPEAGEKTSECGTLDYSSENHYAVEVKQWLKGSYSTASDVQNAMTDDSKKVADTDTFGEKESYTVVMQAITSTEEGNIFKGRECHLKSMGRMPFL